MREELSVTDKNQVQKRLQESLWGEHEWTHDRRITIGSGEACIVRHKQHHEMEEEKDLLHHIKADEQTMQGKDTLKGLPENEEPKLLPGEWPEKQWAAEKGDDGTRKNAMQCFHHG